jgi:hypothetical protein
MDFMAFGFGCEDVELLKRAGQDCSTHSIATYGRSHSGYGDEQTVDWLEFDAS